MTWPLMVRCAWNVVDYGEIRSGSHILKGAFAKLQNKLPTTTKKEIEGIQARYRRKARTPPPSHITPPVFTSFPLVLSLPGPTAVSGL